jgi:hypothetical protein
VKAGFLEKLIERLGRIGPEEVQNYFLRLAQEKGFLETVFNAIQEGIIVTDAKGRITYPTMLPANYLDSRAAMPLANGSTRVRGLDWDSLAQSADQSLAIWKFLSSESLHQLLHVPLMIGHRAGDKIDKDAVGRERFRDSASEQVGHALILRDITESRRSAQETIESERLNALTLLAAGWRTRLVIRLTRFTSICS